MVIICNFTKIPLNSAAAQSVGVWLGNLKGGHFKPSVDRSVEGGPTAGEVPVHLPGPAEVPLSEAQDP